MSKVLTLILFMLGGIYNVKFYEVYELGLKDNTREKFNICDFKKLEEKCSKYIELKKN